MCVWGEGGGRSGIAANFCAVTGYPEDIEDTREAISKLILKFQRALPGNFEVGIVDMEMNGTSRVWPELALGLK